MIRATLEARLAELRRLVAEVTVEDLLGAWRADLETAR